MKYLLSLLLSACSQNIPISPEPTPPAAPSQNNFSNNNLKTLALYVGSDNVCGAAWISQHYALTAQHCLLPSAFLATFDNQLLQFSIAKQDKDSDLALLKLDPPPHPFFSIAPPPSQGDPIFLISHSNLLDWSLKTSIVSSIRPIVGSHSKGPFIQIQTPIFHGDSGSPIFNSSNQLLGVVSFSVKDKNIGFSTHPSTLRSFLADITLN